MSPNPTPEPQPQLQAALTSLALHAEVIVKTERERDWLPIMRNKAFELRVHDDLKDAELQSYLEAAERRQTTGRAYQKGEGIDAEETVFLLDGLIKLGQANIIIGQPKVGKSSFSTGLIRALRERQPQFLGRDFALPSAPMPVLLLSLIHI